MRLAKFIANSGFCSRRDAEKLIEKGCVSVDGVVISTPAVNVSEKNSVSVNGEKINTIPDARLWVYYKPNGLITSHKDTHNRPTIFDQLKKKLPRVISVGRLDLNSEGLLLLTNNGDLSRYFESPVNKFERVYKVRVHGNGKAINIKNKKITIDGVIYNPKSINLIRSGKTNSWYEVILTEGKNREIRKIFQHFGFQVNRLIRTEFGKYDLGDLKIGEYKEVKIDADYSWKT